MRKFKDVLAQLRLERNISQRYLSEQLGLSHSTIGMYENGKREPNYETLESIADYFNVDMNYLLGKSLIRNSYRNPFTIECPKDQAMYNEIEILEKYNKLSKHSKELIELVIDKELEKSK